MEKLTKFDIQWNEKYSLLKDFKEENGHCNVPQNYNINPSLGRWVIRQRVRKDKLSPDKIKKLNDLCFVWDIFEYTWQQHFSKLLSYKKANGHCSVSKGDLKNLSLANWIIKQRQHRKNGKLTLEKIQLLDKLEFVWVEYSRTPWTDNLNKLKEFKKKFGHCNVPRKWSEDAALSNWVAIQRKNKEKLNENQRNSLNSIGFQWRVKKRMQASLNEA